MKICLNMIVKDDAHVIQRCLESVMPYIDCAVIHDTGSTDNTVQIIIDVFEKHGKAIVVGQADWRDFASNRNAAIQHARAIPNIDYILVMDADDTFHTDKLPVLTADVYQVEMRLGDLAYFRPALFKTDTRVQYVGKVHEYLAIPHVLQIATLSNAYITARSEGARSKDPDRWQRDIDLLLTDANDGEPRAQYYLAQSYRNAGLTELASLWYARRKNNSRGYFEEQWHAAYMKARLTDSLLDYFDAYNMMPTRAEPLYRAAQKAGLKTATAMMLLETADQIDEPPITSLFVETDVYRYLITIDLAVAYHYQGSYMAAIHTNERALHSNYIPDDKKRLVIDNMSFSQRELDKRTDD